MIAGIEHLLKGLIGLDAESIGHTAVLRAVRQRMAALCRSDEQAYAQLLAGDAEEQQTLIDAVVVNETWFFRYPESFKALARLAREKSVQAGRPLRFLSLPCSSGEEPFSIVMALLDAGLPEQAFTVDAMDISHRVLALAREGLYGSNAFRNSDLSFRERHFTPEGSGYRLQEQVRRQVRFQCGNLLDGCGGALEPGYDIIFCRNLLIYFDRPVQQRALQALRHLLHPDGSFFVGPAETSLFRQSGMQALDEALTFAFRLTPENPPPRAVRLPLSLADRRTAPRPVPIPWPIKAPTPLPAPAQFGGQRDVVHSIAEAERSLDAVKRLADRGQGEAALEACLKHLTRHGPSADCFFWMGLLCDATGQPAAAQDYFRKSLYLNPCHPEALLHMATLLAARGDVAGAHRLQQRASHSTRRSA